MLILPRQWSDPVIVKFYFYTAYFSFFTPFWPPKHWNWCLFYLSTLLL